MALTDRADVLVVGFGLAGAAAAIGAAEAGADVLVLDKLPLEPPRAVRPGHREAARPDRGETAPDTLPEEIAWWSSRRPARRRRGSGAGLRGLLRDLAVERGVRVRPQATVHELLVEGRRVVGAGYSAIGPDTAEAAWHRRLYRMSLHARGSSAIVREVFTEAAERLWEESFVLGTVECAAVVVATPPSGWEFADSSLTPALAAEGHAGSASIPMSPGARTHPTAVPALRVDAATGAVFSAGGWPVPGLFSATAGVTDRCFTEAEVVAAGRRAGRGCLSEQVR
ncbi:FAD-binding protein [Amycolatopsis sp.]|uniref:FAD-binding protein n=1 Tax=Amycolatopsis sp. TaxID=37632 RepID=UPI002C327D45|nr:FAD-binding protein [Amycolatopsis sp.]HVV08152.1 FAD-binding protein [Amycolatopsis sp.]